MPRFIIELCDYPDSNLLSKFCIILIEKHHANLLGKIGDFDSVYIDFEINSNKITLHQHTMVGIEIFPTNLDNPTKEEIELVNLLGEDLKNLK